MKRFRNILFYADREDGLAAALDRAVALSGSNDARITVMDVIPEAGIAAYIQQTYALDIDATLREQRLQTLEALVQPHIDAGVPIFTKVTTGTAFVEIIRAVQRNDFDLVMKVAQHDTGTARKSLGSTDMHLLRKCPCPVWIDRLGDHTGYHRILAAIDPFDDASGDLQRTILELSLSMSEREQTRLDILHAWQLPGESMFANGRGRIPRIELDMLLGATETSHREALDALLEPYRLSTASDNVHLLKGRPAATIMNFATEQNIDLIVMGTLGRIGIAGMLIGNTAEDVLRETRTAVLALKVNGFVSPVM